MTIFPGRTLEEIDRINLPRLERAMAAKRIQQVEERRSAYLRQELSKTAISNDEWAMIAEHDRLVGVEDGID